MNNLLDAEKAAVKWLKIDFLRNELLRAALAILQHRRGGLVLSANDFKAAWAFLCRTAPQLESGAMILRERFSPDSDSDDSLYDPENDDMSVDEPQSEDPDGSESKVESDEELIVLGPDSETESDEEKESGTGVVEMSLVDNGEQEMADNVSLVANALLESFAPPEVFNQLQVRSPIRLLSSCG